MIERILPPEAVAVETFEDPLDVTLFAEEEAAVARAVEKRRREFTTARDCARRALQMLGRPPEAIPVGPGGEPHWPAGIVGSITHCAGYRACAIAEASDLVTIGIDAEPHEPLPDGVLPAVAVAEERPLLRDLSLRAPEVHWDRILFSAKESVYKAWFPLARRWLGFEDAAVTLDPDGRTFSAQLLVPGPSLASGELTILSGRWLVRDGLAITAITLASPAS